MFPMKMNFILLFIQPKLILFLTVMEVAPPRAACSSCRKILATAPSYRFISSWAPYCVSWSRAWFPLMPKWSLKSDLILFPFYFLSPSCSIDGKSPGSTPCCWKFVESSGSADLFVDSLLRTLSWAIFFGEKNPSEVFGAKL